MARKICDFNHISPELSREQVDELIGYYKTTHQKWFLDKKAYNNYKLIKYAARLTSGAIAGGGIASVIISGSVLTIISLAASLLIEIILDYKNVNENMNNCKYAYQSYQHLMIRIKTALRLGQFNSQNLVNAISNLDNFIVDICPLVDKYKKIIIKNMSLVTPVWGPESQTCARDQKVSVTCKSNLILYIFFPKLFHLSGVSPAVLDCNL